MVDSGQRSGGAPASRDKVPIIVVCSTSDVELADEAAAGLRSRGFDVALMGAAEDGSDRLAEVVERFERQGLYVLCRGGELDRDGIDRLRGLLRAHEVPFGRTLTLPTAQGGARGLEERVVSVARRMVTGRFQRTPGEIAAEPEDGPAQPESDAHVDPADVAGWADSLANGVGPMLDPSLSEELPTAVVGDSADGAAVTTPIDVEDAVQPTDPSVHADEYTPIDTTLVSHHPDPSLIEPEESSAPSPSVAPPMPDDEDISASEFSSGPNIRLLAGGGIAVALIIALVVVLSGSSESDEAPETPSPSSDAQTVAAADAEPASAEPEADPAEVAPPKEPLAATPTEDVDVADPEPAPAGDVAANDDPLANLDLEGAEKALAHRSSVDLALLDDSPLPSTAPEDRAAIAQALEDREVRSWNAFLLAGDDAPAMTFANAETFCKTLTAGGITGWRLPSIGELLSLNGAKMLDRKGVFWSETPGDAFGDTRMVVNAKKGSTSAVTVGWDGARPICVRVRE